MKIEIDGEFHDYCVGCEYLDLIVNSRTIHGKPVYTCGYHCRCEQLLNRLSTIRNDPPDLMEQIAAICREKGISVEEAVELFRKL